MGDTADHDATGYDTAGYKTATHEPTGHEKTGHESTDQNGDEDVEAKSTDKEKPQEDVEAFELTGSKLLLVMMGLATAIFLASLDSAIIATAIPRITSQFHSTDDIGWYGSAYSFAMCAFQPISGKLFANFSMKTMFFSFMAIFELGSLLSATAVDSKMLIIARAIGGVGGSGITTGGMSIVAAGVPLHKRGTYLAILHSTYGVATILGPILGGVLTQHTTWRWCFYINLPIGAVTIAFLVLFFNPPPRRSDGTSIAQKLAKLDLIGALLFIPAIIMVLLALQWGGTKHAWKSATIIGLFVGGAGLIVVLIFWQIYKGDNAMIPPRLMTQRTIFVACFINFFAMGAVMTTAYYLPEWFQAVKAASPTKSGVMYLPVAISDIIAAFAAGASVSKAGYANPFIFAGTALMSIGTGLFTTFRPPTSHQHWIPFQVLQGLGAGMTLTMPYMATQTVLKGDDIPVGTSMVQLFQFLGSAIFLAIAQALFANQLVDSLSQLRGIGIGTKEIDDILHAGSASIRKVVTEAQLPRVLSAYNNGITSTFYVATAAAAASFVITLGLEWRSVKAKKS